MHTRARASRASGFRHWHSVFCCGPLLLLTRLYLEAAVKRRGGAEWLGKEKKKKEEAGRAWEVMKQEHRDVTKMWRKGERQKSMKRPTEGGGRRPTSRGVGWCVCVCEQSDALMRYISSVGTIPDITAGNWDKTDGHEGRDVFIFSLLVFLRNRNRRRSGLSTCQMTDYFDACDSAETHMSTCYQTVHGHKTPWLMTYAPCVRQETSTFGVVNQTK